MTYTKDELKEEVKQWERKHGKVIYSKDHKPHKPKWLYY